MESIRTTGFAPEEVWDVPPITLPAANTHAQLSNAFIVGDSTNVIANILAPGVQVTNRWQWSVRYWGDEPAVYPLGMEALNQGNRRPVILEAKSETGADFKIISHQNINHPMQSIFVQPPEEGAKELKLKIAFPKLNTFVFLARPEFTDAQLVGH